MHAKAGLSRRRVEKAKSRKKRQRIGYWRFSMAKIEVFLNMFFQATNKATFIIALLYFK